MILCRRLIGDRRGGEGVAQPRAASATVDWIASSYARRSIRAWQPKPSCGALRVSSEDRLARRWGHRMVVQLPGNGLFADVDLSGRSEHTESADYQPTWDVAAADLRRGHHSPVHTEVLPPAARPAVFPVCDAPPTLFPDLPDMPHPRAPVAPVLPAQLDAQVLDALVDALMAGASSHARADVVCVVVEELCASVAWLQSAGFSLPNRRACSEF